MKIRAVCRHLMFGCVCAGLFFSQSISAREQERAPAKQEGNAPTVEEAKAFLDDAEARLFDLGNKAQRAAWVQANFITDDTNQIAADAGEILNTLTVELAKKAHRFDNLKLPPEMARGMLLVKLSIGFPAPSNAVEQKQLATISTSLAGDYGKGKWCPDGTGKDTKCLDITAIEHVLATSRDPEELKRAWLGWHAVGAPMRQRYARLVELGNKGSRELGYSDVGAIWRSMYDMPPDQFAKDADRLWEQLRPQRGPFQRSY